MTDAWMPGAARIRAATDGGALKGGAPRTVWQALGFDPRIVSAQSAAQRLNQLNRPSHLVWNPLTGEIVQLIPAVRAGRSIGWPEGMEQLSGPARISGAKPRRNQRRRRARSARSTPRAGCASRSVSWHSPGSRSPPVRWPASSRSWTGSTRGACRAAGRPGARPPSRTGMRAAGTAGCGPGAATSARPRCLSGRLLAPAQWTLSD